MILVDFRQNLLGDLFFFRIQQQNRNAIEAPAVDVVYQAVALVFAVVPHEFGDVVDEFLFGGEAVFVQFPHAFAAKLTEFIFLGTQAFDPKLQFAARFVAGFLTQQLVVDIALQFFRLCHHTLQFIPQNRHAVLEVPLFLFECGIGPYGFVVSFENGFHIDIGRIPGTEIGCKEGEGGDDSHGKEADG